MSGSRKGSASCLSRGASDSIFAFYVPEAGYYPMRLIWENGTGGCNLEWFSVEPDGSMALINDTNAPSYLRAYCVGPLAARAYVSLLVPAVGEQYVDPTSQIYIQLTDGSTQVDANSIGVSVNGTAVTTTTSKVGAITTAQAPLPFLPSGSTNTMSLVYKEVGEPTPITNTWQFVLSTYLVVPPGLGTSLGSGVASKPGFRYRVAQLPLSYITPGGDGHLNPSAEAIEQVLAGLWGPNQGLSSSNIADLSTFTDNGYLDLTAVINMSGANAGAELGYFQTSNGHPDGSAPGVIAYDSGALDQFAAEFLTYVEFPKAGIYGMGVSSDDSFRVMPTDKSPQFMGATLYVSAPSALAGVRIAGSPAWGAGGWGGATPAWPKPAMTAKLVYANPNTACTGSSPTPPANAAELAGNIALVDRGVCEFGWKALAVEQAGAIGVIIVQNRQDLPLSMGAGTYGAQVTIPVMMICQNDGARLAAHLSDPGGVWVTVGWDPELILGEYDNQGGRATGETAFQFGIMQAGVYPFRLVWNQGGGGYSCEWYSIDASGNRTLINDAVSGARGADRAQPERRALGRERGPHLRRHAAIGGQPQGALYGRAGRRESLQHPGHRRPDVLPGLPVRLTG